MNLHYMADTNVPSNFHNLLCLIESNLNDDMSYLLSRKGDEGVAERDCWKWLGGCLLGVVVNGDCKWWR